MLEQLVGSVQVEWAEYLIVSQIVSLFVKMAKSANQKKPAIRIILACVNNSKYHCEWTAWLDFNGSQNPLNQQICAKIASFIKH